MLAELTEGNNLLFIIIITELRRKERQHGKRDRSTNRVDEDFGKVCDGFPFGLNKLSVGAENDGFDVLSADGAGSKRRQKVTKSSAVSHNRGWRSTHYEDDVIR